MSAKRRENVYTCDKCGGFTVTVDVDEGVTPFLIGCRASGRAGECKGHARSAGYPAGPRPRHIPEPQWEWYKPGPQELAASTPELIAYAENGGLYLRHIDRRAEQETPAGYIRDSHGSLRRIQ